MQATATEARIPNERDDRDLMGAREAADLLAMDVRSLARLARRGLVAAHLVDHRWKYERWSVERYKAGFRIGDDELSAADVAERLAVSERKARELMDRGELVGWKTRGGLWRTKREHVDDYLDRTSNRREG